MKLAAVENAADGRMGCQAITIDLPAPGCKFPLRTRRSVVVVGGEEEEGDSWEDADEARTRQFASVLVYDVEDGTWRPEGVLPPMPTPRTAMALCVGLGRVSLARASFAGGASGSTSSLPPGVGPGAPCAAAPEPPAPALAPPAKRRRNGGDVPGDDDATSDGEVETL